MSGKPATKMYNRLCGKCLRHCKQPATVLLVECPRYLPFPFKVEKNRYEQMPLFSPDEITSRPPTDKEES